MIQRGLLGFGLTAGRGKAPVLERGGIHNSLADGACWGKLEAEKGSDFWRCVECSALFLSDGSLRGYRVAGAFVDTPPTCPRKNCRGVRLRECCHGCPHHEGCRHEVDHMDKCTCGHANIACLSTKAGHHVRSLARRGREDDEDREGVVVRPFEGAYGPEAVECETCGASVGVECKRPSGHRGPYVRAHSPRVALAGRTILFGLQCSLCDARDGLDNYVAPIMDKTGNKHERVVIDGLGLPGLVVCQACAVAMSEWVSENAEIRRKKEAYGSPYVLDDLGGFMQRPDGRDLLVEGADAGPMPGGAGPGPGSASEDAGRAEEDLGDDEGVDEDGYDVEAGPSDEEAEAEA